MCFADFTALLRKLLRTFCAVFGAGLFSLRNACGIERAANDVVTHTGEIAHTAAANEDGAVLVEVVTFAGNVNGTFLFVRQADPRDLAQCGVRLFRRRGRNGKADTSLLRACAHDRGLALLDATLSAVLDELVDCRHFLPPCKNGNLS